MTNVESTINLVRAKSEEYLRSRAQLCQRAQDMLDALAEAGFQALSEEQKKTHVIFTEHVYTGENYGMQAYMFAIKEEHLADIQSDIADENIQGLCGSEDLSDRGFSYDHDAELCVFSYDSSTGQARWLSPHMIRDNLALIAEVTATNINEFFELGGSVYRFPENNPDHKQSEQPKAVAPFSM